MSPGRQRDIDFIVKKIKLFINLKTKRNLN